MEDFFETSDLNSCVVLQYFNHQLVTVDKNDFKKCIFHLKKRLDTDNILEDFYAGRLLVEPKRFVSIQKDTKGRIYN